MDACRLMCCHCIPKALLRQYVLLAMLSVFITTSQCIALNLGRRYKPRSGMCAITQKGSDGFGHQLEGKLSCMLTADAFPHQFAYFWSSFGALEHANINVTALNNFVNVAGYGFPSVSAAKREEMRVGAEVLAADPLTTWWNIFESRGPAACNDKVIYQIDNCWPIVYNQSLLVATALNTRLLLKYRRHYLASPKVETMFPEDRPNVVVHVRRGDAAARQLGDDFYERAISHYNATLTSPLFWVESDDPTWAPIHEWHRKWPNDIVIPSSNSSVLTAFHRMVMADGIVCSYSSLCYAAALLNAAPAKLVVSKQTNDEIRRPWLMSHKFLRL